MLNKTRKLACEILLIVTLCLIISTILFLFLTFTSRGIVEEYCFNNNIILDDNDSYRIDNTIFSLGLIISVSIFIIMFLILFSPKINYIKTISKGIEELRKNNYDNKVIILGNNELTDLAKSINYLSIHEKEIKEKERKLNEEKEEFIRNLSHDIRTPLTSIISYTELLNNKENLSKEEQQEYFSLVLKKANQMKDLTNILLDGNKRELSYFEDATLLIKQLVDEFSDELENDYNLYVDLTSLNKFNADVDVNELRRIFDNLVTNIKKYASKEDKVELIISYYDSKLEIIQRNKTVR